MAATIATTGARDALTDASRVPGMFFSLFFFSYLNNYLQIDCPYGRTREWLTTTIPGTTNRDGNYHHHPTATPITTAATFQKGLFFSKV